MECEGAHCFPALPGPELLAGVSGSGGYGYGDGTQRLLGGGDGLRGRVRFWTPGLGLDPVRDPSGGDGELAPSAVGADVDVWRGGDGRMAERAGTVTVETDLRGHGYAGIRIAFRANHCIHLGQKRFRLQHRHN